MMQWERRLAWCLQTGLKVEVAFDWSGKQTEGNPAIEFSLYPSSAFVESCFWEKLVFTH